MLTSRERKYSDEARKTIGQLGLRIDHIRREVEASRMWRAIVIDDAPNGQVMRLLSELFGSISRYQGLTCEAGFRMISRIQKTEERLILSLLRHKCEEATHGAWARRDFERCGGDPKSEMLLSPAEAAVVGMWNWMADHEDPMAYLGAEYLFERLTAELTPKAAAALSVRNIDAENIGFIIAHATEDIKHTELVTHWIMAAVTRDSRRAAAIQRGFELFAQVYPLPLWDEVVVRACR